MSTARAGMAYEPTPISKKPSKSAVKKARNAELGHFSLLYLQGYILWEIRHQIAYTVAGIAVINWLAPFAFPMLFDALRSLFV